MPTCRSCGTYVEWVETTGGKRMPVEQQAGGNIVLQPHLVPDEPPLAVVVKPGHGTHVSHFASCPEAKQWRRDREKTR